MFHKIVLIVFFYVLAASVQPAGATGSDVSKEHRWADQIIDGLMDGDELWLNDGDSHEFLALFTEAEKQTESAVVLIHGIGVHPNWPDVIYPLRVGLMEQGTTTLSLQMPVLANDAESKEYLPLFDESPNRIDSGIAYLREKGYTKITIVAHSMGASMATHYLAYTDTAQVNSLVIIGMNPGIIEFRNLKALEKVGLPVLDIYGSEDLPGVLNFVDDRAKAGNTGVNRQFSQVRVEGANHFFQGRETELLNQVIDWLDTH